MKEKPYCEQPSYALVYAALIPKIREIAREHGYAIGVHGSMSTDFDLIACPWTDAASDPEELAEAIASYVGCDPNHPGLDNPGKKPHGRLVWTLLFDVLKYGGFGLDKPYIDLSIMPRLK